MRYHCAVTIKVQEYLRADGSNPYKMWFDSLDAQAAAKLVTAKLQIGAWKYVASEMVWRNR
jgi:hypothetical protein